MERFVVKRTRERKRSESGYIAVYRIWDKIFKTFVNPSSIIKSDLDKVVKNWNKRGFYE